MFNNLPNGQHDHKYATLDNMRRGGQQYPALQSYQNGSRDASHGAEQPGLGYMPQAPLDYDRSFQRDERYNRDALPQDFAPRDTYQLHKTRTSQQLVARPRSGFSNYTSQTNGTHDTAQTNGTFRTQHVPSRGPPRFNLPKPIGRRSTINGDEDGDFDIPGYNTRSSRRVESIADYVRPTGDSRSGSTSSQTLTRISSDTARGPPRQTPYTLAQAIMKGETEDPDDRAKLHRKYTTPSKLSMPAMGPTRFKDSTMFSHAEPPPFTGAPAQETTQLVRSGIGPVKDIIPPLWLSTVMQGMCNPTMEELLDDIPITELCRLVAPSTAGVIKIREIPYATPRAEMISFLGRNAQILRQPEASPYHAVHILLERESGKTMDCYIEVASPDEAAFVVRAFQKRVQAGRPPKVGERTVEVVYSSQDELLSELFPRAKHVQWKDGWPIVDLSPRLYYENEMAAGFQGFIHPEEFVMLLKHANAKERSPFASKSPTRTYEALITIMHKYPWYAPKYIPVHERDRIYDCVLKLMSNLVRAIKESNGQYGPFDLSPPLLQEMVTAALVCPGFSEAQKAKIVGYLQLDGFGEMASGAYTHVYLGGNHALAPFWPFAALSVIPGADIELVKYYGYLFHQATVSGGAMLSPMGDIKIDYKGTSNPKDLSLAAAAKCEYAKIKELLKKVIGPSSDREPTPNPFLDSRKATPTTEPTSQAYSMTQAMAAPHHGRGYSMTEAYGVPQNSASARGSNGSQVSSSHSAARPSSRHPAPTTSIKTVKSDPTTTDNRDTVGKIIRSNFTW